MSKSQTIAICMAILIAPVTSNAHPIAQVLFTIGIIIIATA